MLSRGTMMENPSESFSRGRHMLIYVASHTQENSDGCSQRYRFANQMTVCLTLVVERMTQFVLGAWFNFGLGCMAQVWC